MTREREGDLERICQEALELPVVQRADFLVEACGGDEGLRREAEALLAQDGAAASFLATPAMAMAARELDAGPALAAGQQFGPYTIVSRLGAGGMGEVYRARDPTLRRDVAIKVLPTLFTRDPERLARFEREAQLLASLNHPNIATIHGLEHVDGIHALVLEVVEGETLAERLQSAASGSPRHRSRSHGDDGRSRAGLPLAEALTIAQQIAAALEAAHERGVIHRDLKPANIKIRPDGVVKVLDFGLAKAAARDASAADAWQAPTLSEEPTREGVILGTAAYMSPEQARGQVVDKRTDIWAFGCVLYEMLAGQGPFTGPTVTDTLAAILEREPNWGALSPTLHPRIHELLRGCLEKDPKKRRRDIADVRMEIEQVLSGPAQTVAPPVDRASRHRARLAWIVATVLVVALAAVVAGPYFSGTSGTPETRVDISTPEAPDPTSFAISPDGRRLVFVAFRNGQTQLFLRSLDGDSTQPLSGTEAANLPFWSPDGRSVGFFALQELKRIDIDGGLVQTVARARPGPGATWGPEGLILFGDPMGPLFRVPASSGQPVAVTSLGPGQSAHQSPVFLPGGRQFLFYATGTEDARGIYLGSLDSPDTTRLTDADTSGAFAPSGWLLFARQGALVARRFDPAGRMLSGDPVTVAESVAVGFFQRAAVSVSATGTIAYRTGAAKASQLTWFDRTGRAVDTLGEPSPAGPWNVALSRDGLRAAVERTGDIWIIDSRGTTPFTVDTPGGQRFPLWSPDSPRIAYANQPPDGVYVRSSNGDGGGELLLTPRKILSDWSRDGRFLLYFEVDNKTRTDLWVLPVVGDREPRLFLRTDSNEQWGQFSPDGRWIAYQSDESGRFEIYVRPFPGPAGRATVSTSGGIHPRWSRDGTELFFLAPDGTLTSARIVVTGQTIEPGVPVPLFPTRIVGGGGNLAGYRHQYDVAPDGRFLINVGLESDPPPIRLLYNWKPRE